MTQYLGISMVVIVIAMCIGILATIVSEAIFKQIEDHRRRVKARKMAMAKELIEVGAKYWGEYSKNIKNVINDCKKAEDEGLEFNKETAENIFKAAKDAAEKVTDKKE